MNITVLGAGTWGIALSKLLFENGHKVTVWSAVKEELDYLIANGRHKNLPGAEIPAGIVYTQDFCSAVKDKDFIIMAVASKFQRSVAGQLAEYVAPETTVINVSKGIEAGTLCTMTDVIREELAKVQGDTISEIVALSGPTHAEEVAIGIPTSIVAACTNEDTAREVAKLFANSCMRVYTNPDVLGVELCGAMKNIIALAAGIIRGLGGGDNTTALLMTRGIAEMTRIGLEMGAKRRTFMGLTGLGDMIVTCTSRHSRNNRCGELMGQGMTYEEASKEVGMVVEGYYTLDAAMELSRKYNVELPITAAVYDIAKRGKDPRETMQALMVRAMRSELD